MSVPIPKGDPPNAMRADSPPEEPPDVNFLFRGFKVLPKTLFTVSAIIIAVGTFVLTYKIAPASLSMSTIVELYVAGSLTQLTKPTVVSNPTTLKLSLIDIGKP